ncbi:MAG: hypothetical protein HQK78_04255 [Desulfobacterales bacterium]|nr:hypothetical protein [Desulfobacterales bacterium]
MKIFLSFSIILIFIQISADYLYSKDNSNGPANSLIIAPDIIERAAKLSPKNMSQSPLQGNLSDWEKAVLNKLIQAANYMDIAYWQQVDPEGEKIFKSLSKTSGAMERSAHFMMNANYGRWDRFKEFDTFIGTTKRPPGGYVYPSDLSKAEFDSYLTKNPSQQSELMNPFTVISREKTKLIVIPYHKAYAEYVLPAADLLDQAAALSQNISLKKYLNLEANALRTDDYFEANMAWLDLDANLDFSIGPHETYDDQLTGQKAFYKANVLVVDKAAESKLNKYKATVPILQSNLPVDLKYKPDQTGTMTPLILADDIRRSGQARAIMEPVAFSLPNDPKVWEKKGSKKVMMGNYLSTRRTTVLEPLAMAILDTSSDHHMNGSAYFTWVLMHEISHTLGPREVVKDGQKITIRKAIGEYYSAIEEGKADIGGLYNLPYLIEKGIVEDSLVSHYVGYLAESLRSIRFGMGSPYGVIRSATWNILVENGALIYDANKSKFILNVDKMTAVVKDILKKLILIEGEGDTKSAAMLIKKYSHVEPVLQKLLDEADKSVPLEFLPVYE